MARIFITGSADGLGQLAAKALIAGGHEVMLHARNEKRAGEAVAALPGAAGVLTADLSNLEETKLLAETLNSSGRFDAIIHNAGVYQVAAKELLAVNTLAPYILTCLVEKPERSIYLSSNMHMQGDFAPENFTIDGNGISYSDTKLHMLMLAKAVARHWPSVYSNAIDPGWVPTKMGGSGAPDDLQKGYETQVWLAVSNDEKAKQSGRYFHHQKERRSKPKADDLRAQEEFLRVCGELTGVRFTKA